MNITEAVIPAAGVGTRFLPFSKSVPKELVPLIDTPAIHYIIQEGIAAGITDFCIIDNGEKQAIREYLQPNPALDAFLAERHKGTALTKTNKLIHSATYTFCEQQEPRGLGHAVLMAHASIRNPYFAVMLPDDLILQPPSLIGELIALANTHEALILVVQEVPRQQVSSYGIIAYKKQLANNLFQVDDLIEKPSPEQAPSCYAIVGRYILPKTIFDVLAHTSAGSGGEIQLTDAIKQMLCNGQKTAAYLLEGNHFDLGTPAGFLQANMYLGLNSPVYKPLLEKIYKATI